MTTINVTGPWLTVEDLELEGTYGTSWASAGFQNWLITGFGAVNGHMNYSRSFGGPEPWAVGQEAAQTSAWQWARAPYPNGALLNWWSITNHASWNDTDPFNPAVPGHGNVLNPPFPADISANSVSFTSAGYIQSATADIAGAFYYADLDTAGYYAWWYAAMPDSDFTTKPLVQLPQDAVSFEWEGTVGSVVPPNTIVSAELRPNGYGTSVHDNSVIDYYYVPYALNSTTWGPFEKNSGKIHPYYDGLGNFLGNYDTNDFLWRTGDPSSIPGTKFGSMTVNGPTTDWFEVPLTDLTRLPIRAGFAADAVKGYNFTVVATETRLRDNAEQFLYGATEQGPLGFNWYANSLGLDVRLRIRFPRIRYKYVVELPIARWPLRQKELKL